MNWTLYDGGGRRKYLTADEREAFVRAAMSATRVTRLFCLTMAFSGARISEVLHLRAEQIDRGTHTIVIETLKRRRRGVFRAVPLPNSLITELCELTPNDSCRSGRLWPWCRTTAWRKVKLIMLDAGIPAYLARPRALRHAFGVCASEQRIVLSLVQKWLGHAKIETTAIYATPSGAEERALAKLMWFRSSRDAMRRSIPPVDQA